MKRMSRFLIFLLSLLMFSAISNAETISRGLRVEIAGEKFDQEIVNDYANRRVDLRTVVKSPIAAVWVAREFAFSRALVLEGIEIGHGDISNAKSALSENDFFRLDVYAESVYKKIAAQCEVSAEESDLYEYYKNNPEVYRAPTRVRLSRIMLPTDKRMDVFDSRAWLLFQARAIAEGAVSFETVMRRVSEEVPEVKQGDIGYHLLIGDDPLIDSLRDVKVGDMVGPVVMGSYVVLLRVEEKQPGRLLNWEDVKLQAKTMADEYCRDKERKGIMNKLFEKYGVKIVVE